MYTLKRLVAGKLGVAASVDVAAAKRQGAAVTAARAAASSTPPAVYTARRLFTARPTIVFPRPTGLTAAHAALFLARRAARVAADDAAFLDRTLPPSLRFDELTGILALFAESEDAAAAARAAQAARDATSAHWRRFAGRLRASAARAARARLPVYSLRLLFAEAPVPPPAAAIQALIEAGAAKRDAPRRGGARVQHLLAGRRARGRGADALRQSGQGRAVHVQAGGARALNREKNVLLVSVLDSVFCLR